MPAKGQFKISNEILAKRIIEIQKEKPLGSIAHICATLESHRDLLTERGKKSPLVACAIKKALEIRQSAWDDLLIDSFGKKQEQHFITGYIWRTRNMFNWNDKVVEKGSVTHDAKNDRLVIDFGDHIRSVKPKQKPKPRGGKK